MNKPHLGDYVEYNGRVCFLNQGVANPYWDLIDVENRASYKHIHVSKFKLSTSINRKLWAIKSTYSFYMQAWFLIDTYHKPLFQNIQFKLQK